MKISKINQYRFNCTDKELIYLTTKNVSSSNNSIDVNIHAIFTIKKSCKINDVRIVVGEGYPNKTCETKQQEIQFEKNLNKLCIDYTKKKVLQITNTHEIGVPGVYRTNITPLVCKNIPISSSYVGDPSNIDGEYYINNIFDIPSNYIDKAKCILENLELDDCETELCINRHNVDF